MKSNDFVAICDEAVSPSSSIRHILMTSFRMLLLHVSDAKVKDNREVKDALYQVLHEVTGERRHLLITSTSTSHGMKCSRVMSCGGRSSSHRPKADLQPFCRWLHSASDHNHLLLILVALKLSQSQLARSSPPFWVLAAIVSLPLLVALASVPVWTLPPLKRTEGTCTGWPYSEALSPGHLVYGFYQQLLHPRSLCLQWA